ncbi:fructokinase [Phycicoccus badiiscoriae]|uniref:Fructokinase n=1 Tax=Pedococcus badiiscoriae TaxID=642776 RepID=A0A852WLY4_9MICO|nr:fructokinase [Pedococcus badiiscoriae]
MHVRNLVIGEALVDIVLDSAGTRAEHVGGSPANVAIGLARLGHDVDFACRLGRDERGERIASHLRSHGVTVLPQSFGELPTSTALATLDEHATATYTFDLHWDLPAIPLPDGTGHLHTGSLGTILEPGAQSVTDALVRGREHGTVSYDPNIRPGIMGELEPVRARVEELVRLSDVVKASGDDLAYLYPDESAGAVMTRWLGQGPSLVVVTLGPDGVAYRVASGPDESRAPTAARTVVDTVGAGDSFMAGLLSGLLASGLLGDPGARERLRSATLEDVRPAVERGIATSGVTVGRAGAYAPGLDEL